MKNGLVLVFSFVLIADSKLKRLVKILLTSAGLVVIMHFANQTLADTDSITPKTITYLSSTGDWNTSLPRGAGQGQLKATFEIDPDLKSNGQKELIIAFLGSYEVFWEGKLIGINGKAADAQADEIPGQLDQKFIVPDTLIQPGENELILKYSDHFNHDRANITEISIATYNEFYKRTIIQAMLIYALAGIFLIVTVYYLFLYFYTFRKASYFLFALLCGASLVLIVYAYSRNYYPYIYTQYATRQVVIWTFSSLISLLLPFFYLYYFDLPRRNFFNVAIPGVFLISAIVSWPLGTLFTVLAILLPLGFVIWALIKNRRGSTEAMIGLLVFLSSFMYFNISVYVGFGILVIITLLSLSINLGLERKAHEQSLLRSSRLESQLLKKNIQPHFLMNTLTNIISLIESDPKMSVRLIEALSNEFYTLIEIADKQLIPIEKEVELCRSHLEIMSIRNDIYYELKTNSNGTVKIPPAVLHTLFENGITHNSPIDGKVLFRLDVHSNGKSCRISLETYGQPKDEENMIKDGTGFKYIKTRLEESFPGKWELKNEKAEFGWKTEIKMLHENTNR
ncbi:sensor histidine kinase [Ekhidna sp.]|uniref:sensor histidine kinase n=1 Tax=Ekhidna sp. TaxID=2608089 RepID=UPI003CCBBD01